METEERLSIAPLPKASILKIEHHGSANGTDIRMLKQVSPKIVVISYETGSPYGFPHKEVVSEIHRMHIIRFDTDQGTVVLRTDGEKVTYQNSKVVE